MTPRNAFVMRETFASKQALVLRGLSATALRVVMRDSGSNHGCSAVVRGPGSARARGRARLWRGADRTEPRGEPCPEHNGRGRRGGVRAPHRERRSRRAAAEPARRGCAVATESGRGGGSRGDGSGGRAVGAGAGGGSSGPAPAARPAGDVWDRARLLVRTGVLREPHRLRAV